MSEQPILNWRKLGHVFVADGRYSWMQQFGQVPTAMRLENCIRVYFSCRPQPDANGDFVSLTTFLDVDIADPATILAVHSEPVLSLGAPGTFDQFGVMPCCAIRVADEVWLYYVGWSRSRGVPWQAAIGLAISRDGGTTFHRYAAGPIISRTPSEPFVQGSPCVVRIGSQYRMWYLSGIRWDEHEGRQESIYRLMSASSADGISWVRDARECLTPATSDECQARPTVWQFDGRYHMLFSSRRGVDFRNAQRGYRVGYASSADGIDWQRDDSKAGLRRSEYGWDSEMVAYPNVIDVDGRRLCFYCGNMMGHAGFGVAELRNGDKSFEPR